MADIAWFESAYLQNMTRPGTHRPVSPPARAVRTHRTIFISDTHLGTRGCKAEALADFLLHNVCDTLYLVGDIVDGWQLRHWHWSAAQTRVVDEILHKIDHGANVIFVPGNHDEFARAYAGRLFAGITVANEAIHETADGKRLLVLHGDQFDSVIACAKWLARLGDRAYGVALRANDVLADVRRRMGLPYWSLSAWAKHKVKNAASYISRFETAVAAAARARGLDGVVCGHIHHAEIRAIDGILYHNDGDWVESCSALVEDARGHLEILHWANPSQANSCAAGTAHHGAPALIPA